eukprot:2186378-Rhodomonas_salina.1
MESLASARQLGLPTVSKALRGCRPSLTGMPCPSTSPRTSESPTPVGTTTGPPGGPDGHSSACGACTQHTAARRAHPGRALHDNRVLLRARAVPLQRLRAPAGAHGAAGPDVGLGLYRGVHTLPGPGRRRARSSGSAFRLLPGGVHGLHDAVVEHRQRGVGAPARGGAQRLRPARGCAVLAACPAALHCEVALDPAGRAPSQCRGDACGQAAPAPQARGGARGGPRLVRAGQDHGPRRQRRD